MFSLDSEKNFPLTLASCLFENISLQAINCKKPASQKIPKVNLLSSLAFTIYSGDIFRFISSVFSLCIESSIQ